MDEFTMLKAEMPYGDRKKPTPEEIEEMIKPEPLLQRARGLCEIFLNDNKEQGLVHACFIGGMGLVIAGIEMPDTSKKRGEIFRHLILETGARAFLLIYEGWNKALDEEEMTERGLMGHPDWTKTPPPPGKEPTQQWWYDKPLAPELGKLWNIPTSLNCHGKNCHGDDFILARVIDTLTRETIREYEMTSWKDGTHASGELMPDVPSRTLVGIERAVYQRMGIVPPPEFREGVLAAKHTKDPAHAELIAISEAMGIAI